MMAGLRRCAPLALCAVLLSSSLSSAQEDAVAQAKALFNAGAKAYELGQFDAAIQAFEQAYKLAPRPGILFSIAQAYRRQFFIDKHPEHLSTAIARYHEYLAEVPQGGRRGDVAQALAEIEPIAARLASSAPEKGEPAAASPSRPPEAKPQTRLMISSQIEEAVVSVDGHPPAELPFIEQVAPGKHKLKVTASGYLDDDREIVAVEGGVVAVDIPLREKPALLTVVAEDRADVSIDGRLVGTAPLARPLELPAGRYLVTVSRSGRKPFSRDVELARDERRTVGVKLETTDQRYASIVLMGAGIAGAIVGGVFVGVALHEENIATDIEEEIAGGNAAADRRSEYNSALESRDDLRRGAAIAFGVSAAVGSVGVVLYLTDFPKTGAVASKDEPRTPAPQRPLRRDEPSLEVSAVPVLGLGFAGAAIGGRF